MQMLDFHHEELHTLSGSELKQVDGGNGYVPNCNCYSYNYRFGPEFNRHCCVTRHRS